MKLLQSSFLRYAIVGLGTNAFLYVVFLVILWSGLAPATAAAVCYIFGLTLSYLINRSWSFQSDTSHRRDLPRFLFSYGAGLLATLGFILVLTLWLPPEIAQIINIGLTAVVIYLCLRLTGFGKGEER